MVYNTMSRRIKATRFFSDELLQQYRQQGDAPADAVIAAVVESGGPTGLRVLMQWLADTTTFSTDDQHPAVENFVRQYAELPTWADSARMKRGMAFFNRHARQIGLALGLYSLPFSYLGGNGAQLLWLTQRIKTDTLRRLQETGEWVVAVNNPTEWTSKKAILRTLKIRLIHAGSRWFGLHSGRWDMAWGYPVNQEDMAGTNLTFSYIVLLGLRKLGNKANELEEEDYLHHINVVNYLNGVSEELLPQNLREAYVLIQAIARRQFAPSEAGVGLTQALLNAIVAGLTNQPTSQTVFNKPATNRSKPDRSENLRNLVAGEMRFFLGDQYADWLGIPPVPVEKRLVGLLNRFPIFSL